MSISPVHSARCSKCQSIYTTKAMQPAV